MQQQIIRTILAGMLAGLLLFLFPFILSSIFFFWAVLTIFRLLKFKPSHKEKVRVIYVRAN